MVLFLSYVYRYLMNIFFSQKMLIQAAKLIEAGMAIISLAGTGAETRILFGAFLNALARNPNVSKILFVYTILGCALSESISFFGWMVRFFTTFWFWKE